MNLLYSELVICVRFWDLMIPKTGIVKIRTEAKGLYGMSAYCRCKKDLFARRASEGRSQNDDVAVIVLMLKANDSNDE